MFLEIVIRRFLVLVAAGVGGFWQHLAQNVCKDISSWLATDIGIVVAAVIVIVATILPQR